MIMIIMIMIRIIMIITQFHSKIFIPVLDNVEATRGEAGPERLQGEELV